MLPYDLQSQRLLLEQRAAALQKEYRRAQTARRRSPSPATEALRRRVPLRRRPEREPAYRP